MKRLLVKSIARLRPAPVIILLFALIFSGWPQIVHAAVAHIGASESHTGTSGSTNQASFSWSHTPGGTARGVVVFVTTISQTKTVTSVTYGGVAMTQIPFEPVSGATEPGRMDAFFLGTSIPTGNQTIVVNRTNNATAMYAAAATVSGATDTEVYLPGVVILDSTGALAVQPVSDGVSGANSVRYAAGYSAGNNVIPAGTGSTKLNDIDFGNFTTNFVRETTAGQGTRNVGLEGGSGSRAAVHLAIREQQPNLEQSAYRLFANTNSTDVGSALAALNTAPTLASAGVSFRLRTLFHINTIALPQNGKTMKLQFSERSGTCDTSFSGESYADVTSSTLIAYNNNPTPADGANLTANANDPTHSGHTIVNQTYEEANNFTNSVSAVSAGQDGKWDFSLRDNGAVPGFSYCLRAVYSSDDLLETYSVVPEITTAEPPAPPITYQSTGDIGYFTGTAVAYPASVAANDLLVLIVGQKPQTANGGGIGTPQDWTAVPDGSLTGAGGYGGTLSDDTGNTNIFAFYKVATGSETGNLWITHQNNNVAWAQIYRLSNATANWQVAGTTGQDTAGGAGVSIPFSSNPGVAGGDLVIGAMTIPTDVTTPSQFSAEAFSQTGVTFGTVTEVSEPDSGNSLDIGGFVVYAPVSSGTGSANPTMTATAATTNTNVRGPGVFIRVRATGTITWQTPGALAYTPNDTTTQNNGPSFPASIAAGNLLMLVVGQKPGIANSGSMETPASWTAVPGGSVTGAGGYGGTLGADTGNTNIFTFYKVASGPESGNLLISLGDSNVAWAQIYRLSNASGQWEVAGTTGSDTTGNAAVDIPMTADPDVTVGDFILGAMVAPTDVDGGSKYSAQNFTQSGSAFDAGVEISEPFTANGNDIGGFVAYSPQSIWGSGTGNPSLLATAGGTLTNVRGPGVFIRIREGGEAPSTLSFSISDNTVGFGTLSSSNARYATGDINGSNPETGAHTITASTNATGGYVITVRGGTLTAAGGHTVNAIGGTSAASNPGTEQFGLRVTASGGNGAAVTPYNHASNYAYGATASVADNIASDPDGNDVPTTYSIYYLGNIAPQTEAGSYSATLTYIITAAF